MAVPDCAIILAAGRGKRLLPETASRPKALLPVGEETILHYQVRVLRALGIGRIAVVTGFSAELVRHALGPSVAYIHNERHCETNSLYSLHMAEAFGREGCLILNADVLFHPGLLERLLAAEAADALLVDRAATLGEEEMKVSVRGGVVAGISKAMQPAQADGENVGLIKTGPAGAQAMFAVARQCAVEGRWNQWTPYAVEALIGKHDFAAISTGQLPWIEIDYLHDLKRARSEVYPRIAEGLDVFLEARDSRRNPAPAGPV